MKVDVHQGAVDNLVKQFSSALDCLRELVQNSIDAGSPRVDIWMDFEASEAHRGTITLHVDDFGEGMDEAIIDSHFTQLFSSSKENDLTKIGKFGIGFVSVFALEPKGILVHTGRGGEYWEVFFHEDRSYSKTPIPTPVEGTQMTLFIEGDRARYTSMVHDAKETLQKWCAHSDTEISFEDRHDPDGEQESINAPFEVPGELMTRVEHQGTEIVLAYTDRPGYGFFNRGLTLASSDIGEKVLDHRSERYAHIALKVKSRYLEHTLSRDTVLRDDNYEKAMRMVDDAANGPLLDALLDQLTELAQRETWGTRELHEYANLGRFLLREPAMSFERACERPLLRRLLGGGISAEQLAEDVERDERLLIAESTSQLVHALDAQGVPVLLGRSQGEDQPLDILRALVVRSVYLARARSLKTRARQVWGWLFSKDVNIQEETLEATAAPAESYFPVRLDDEVPSDCAALLDATRELLEKSKTGYKRVLTCSLSAPSQTPPLFVVGRKLAPIMARPPKGLSQRKRKRMLEAAINREHPHFERLKKLHARAPELASYCLAKDLLLHHDRLLHKDVELMRLAQETIR